MKILVCGGRGYNDSKKVKETLDELARTHGITDVIHGAAHGADNLAGIWARANRREDGRYIREWRFPADWSIGRGAGPIRNKQMLEEGHPDLVVAFPGGKGTENMISIAIAAQVPVMRVE